MPRCEAMHDKDCRRLQTSSGSAAMQIQVGWWRMHVVQAAHARGCARRIRKCWLEGTPVALVGQRCDLSYPYEHLGEGGAALAKLLKGGPALDMLKSAERPAVIVGPGILSRGDRGAVLQQARAQPACLPSRMPGWLWI